jgi:quinol monooxygenase YgiN
MVLATIRMLIPSKKQNEALNILRSVAEQNRVQRSCLGCRVYKDVEEDRFLMFEEMWRSEEDLKNHLRSQEYSKVLLVIEMALQPPEMRFNVVTRWSGIEMVEKARNATGREGSL